YSNNVHIHFKLNFFSNDTPTTCTYTLSLHDALPISKHPRADEREDEQRRGPRAEDCHHDGLVQAADDGHGLGAAVEQIDEQPARSEEHTSELQSQSKLVCRLLLEKKKAPVNGHSRPR